MSGSSRNSENQQPSSSSTGEGGDGGGGAAGTVTSSSSSNEQEKGLINLSSITTNVNNHRGIPEVIFIEDIGKFASSFTPTASPELLIGAFSDLFGKYKTYESNLNQKKGRFQQKIPEIEKSLNLVKHLKKKMEEKEESGEEVITRYNLADTLYARAEIDCNGTVNLWLGANVMLEYTYDEAIDLLSSKEEIARREYQEVLEDLAFTRNQIITSEVNISRIYNYDVRLKREAKRRASLETGGGGGTGGTTATVGTAS